MPAPEEGTPAATGQAEQQSMEQVFNDALTAEQPQAEGKEQADESTSEDTQEQNFTDVDPEKLPPELKKIYKNLQSGFTKKTQEVAALRKHLESKKAVYEAWEPAIEAYNQNPKVREAVDKAYTQMEEAAAKAGVSTDGEFEAFLKQYDPKDHPTLKALRDVLGREIRNELSSEQKKLADAVKDANERTGMVAQAQVERDAAIEAARFEKQHPDWKDELTPRQQKIFLIELHENPDKSPADVYQDVLAEMQGPLKKQESKVIDKLVDRGRRKVNSGSGPSRADEQPASLEAAFKQSLREAGL